MQSLGRQLRYMYLSCRSEFIEPFIKMEGVYDKHSITEEPYDAKVCAMWRVKKYLVKLSKVQSK